MAATARILDFLRDNRPEGPCLVVDLEVIADNYRAFTRAMPDTRIFYAVKANPAPEVLKLLADMGSCFDTASVPEIEMALAAGATPDRISFGNTIKKERDIARAHQLGVKLFAVDSDEEVEKIARSAPGASVFCRILTDGAGAEWPLSRKFGCHPDMAIDLLVQAKNQGLIPYGISFHVGSQQKDIAVWDAALSKVKYMFDWMRLEEDIELKMINLGGGFGRRGNFQDYTRQAVLIAKQLPGTPIKLIWTREEDMTQGRYHPIMACKLTGTFDANKNLTGVHMRLSGQSILSSVRPAVVAQQKGRDPLVFQGVAESGEHGFGYTFPNLLIDHAMRNTHVPPGFWRGVNANQNAIFIECFMDELAEVAGVDPLEFRRQHMTQHPRNLAVLNAVAERIGWSTPAPAGVSRGLAQMKAFGSYVAAACELSVLPGNKVKIHRIVAATDPGYAVNPAQIERQVAGSFVYGLSALFEQECTVKNGRIEQTNFDTFNSMRIAQMPKVETIVIEGGGQEWGGIGEPTICVAAPSVLNAIYRATGQRLRNVPLRKSGFTLV